MTADDPYLYILARNDMASLTAGKLAAQCAHAANQCVNDIAFLDEETSGVGYAERYSDLLAEWEGDRGFGVCIVLDVGTERNLLKTIEKAKRFKLMANVTHDPTYPVTDGDVTHLIPVNTCGYIFGTKSACEPFTSKFKLYEKNDFI